MGVCIDFEYVVPTTKNKLFYQCMVGFVNRLELNANKYQTNETFRE